MKRGLVHPSLTNNLVQGLVSRNTVDVRVMKDETQELLVSNANVLYMEYNKSKNAINAYQEQTISH